jgi:hypothetical protein
VDIDGEHARADFEAALAADPKLTDAAKQLQELRVTATPSVPEYDVSQMRIRELSRVPPATRRQMVC